MIMVYLGYQLSGGRNTEYRLDANRRVNIGYDGVMHNWTFVRSIHMSAVQSPYGNINAALNILL